MERIDNEMPAPASPRDLFCLVKNQTCFGPTYALTKSDYGYITTKQKKRNCPPDLFRLSAFVLIYLRRLEEEKRDLARSLAN
jgi:hypothetical protein